MCCRPASREVQNYLTTIAGTVKKKNKVIGDKKRKSTCTEVCSMAFYVQSIQVDVVQ